MAAPTSPVASTGSAGGLPRALERYERAREQIAEYAVEQAMTSLDEAVGALGDDDSAAAVELRLRVAMSRTWGTVATDAAGTWRRLETIAAEADRLGMTQVVALALLQQGALSLRLGENQRALSALLRVGPYEQTLSVDDRVRLLINRGTAASLLLRTTSASADLGAAAALAREAGLDRFAFMALHNQGYVEYLRGDLPTALRLMDAADRTEAPVDRSVATLDRGRVLIETGLVTEAWEALQAAQAGLATAGLDAEADEAELDLARCEILLGRRAEAEARIAPLGARFAQRSARFREIESRVLLLEAQVFDTDGLTEEAARLARDAADVDPRLAEVAGALYAETLARSGRAQDAPVRPVAALSRSTQLARRCLARRVTVDLALARGDEAGAQRVLKAVVADLRTARRGVSSLDLKTGMALHALPLATADIALAARSGSAARVLMATERWRTATGSMPQVRPSDDPPEQALWTRLRKLRSDLRAADEADLPGIRQGIGQTVAALRRTSWARDLGPTRDDVAASTPEIREALEARGSALAALVLSGDTLLSVVGRPGGRWHLVAVPDAPSILRLARRARTDVEALAHAGGSVAASPLRVGITRSLVATLESLGRLLRPALPGGSDPLLLVPPAPLAGLPWAMLPALRGRPLTVSLSATHWLRHDTLVDEPTVRAVAGPDLRSAAAEQEAVASAWGAASAPLGTGQDLRDALTQADLVHVAAHGQHEPDNPLFSSLLLTDGPTFVHEVEGLRLRASHVVLSACRAGRADARPGTEPLGLTACLLAFGVATVVAPVTLIGDDLALETMASYHRALASGLDAATALAAVTVEAPLLAASFTCFGASWGRA